MDKKYEFTGETRKFRGRTLHRIRLLRDITSYYHGVVVGGFKAGSLGGWIESEKNLSQEGECWVFNEGIVYQDAVVKENAHLAHGAVVGGKAVVRGHALVRGKMTDLTSASGHSRFYGKMYGCSSVHDDAVVEKGVELYDHVRVDGACIVTGDIRLKGRAAVNPCCGGIAGFLEAGGKLDIDISPR